MKTRVRRDVPVVLVESTQSSLTTIRFSSVVANSIAGGIMDQVGKADFEAQICSGSRGRMETDFEIELEKGIRDRPRWHLYCMRLAESLAVPTSCIIPYRGT